MRRTVPLALVLLVGLACGKKPVAPDSEAGGEPRPPRDRFADKTIAEWEAELKSGDGKRIKLAASAVYGWGDEAAALVPALLDLPDASGTSDINMYAIAPKVGAAAVPHLIAGLKSPRAAVRTRAASGLLALGPKAPPAVADLTAVVADPKSSWALRVLAVRALGQIGPAANAAVPTLSPLLKSAERDPNATRPLGHFVAVSLCQIDPTQDDAVAALIEQVWPDVVRFPFGDLKETPEFRTIVGLGKRAVSVLVRQIKDPKKMDNWFMTYFDIADALGADGVPILVELARRGVAPLAYAYDWTPERVRKAAPGLKDMIPELVKRAGTRSTDLRATSSPRVAAIKCLVELGAKEVIPVTLGLLKDPFTDDALTKASFQALARMNEPAAIPLAVRELQAPAGGIPSTTTGSRPGEARREAAEVVRVPGGKDQLLPILKASLTPGGPNAHFAPLVVAEFEPDNPNVYRAWARIQGSTAWEDQEARLSTLGEKPVPHLRKLIDDPDPTTQLGAAVLLAWFAPRDPGIARVLSAQELSVGASRGLYHERSAPAVAPLLTHPLTARRTAAAYMLAGIGPKAVKMAPDLAARAKAETDHPTRVIVLFALGRMGPGAKEHIEPLRAASREESVLVRFVAVQGLANIDRTDPALKPALFELAKLGPPGMPGQGEAPHLGALNSVPRMPYLNLNDILYDVDPEGAVRAGWAAAQVGWYM
jgi:HEAT repeat protein